MSKLKMFFVLSLLMGAACCSKPYQKYSVVSGDPLKAHHYVLKNGLEVFITENHEKPVFYAEVAIRAGHKNDPADATGIAHYLEHMLFKGTGKIGTLNYKKEKLLLDKITKLYERYFHTKEIVKRKKIFQQINLVSAKAAKYAIPNELDKIYSKIGATRLNAHTGAEETVYKVQVPANHLKTWAQVESERFLNPVFRLFTTELETVFEEKNRSLDNKDRYFWKEVMAKVFKKHPYGQQTTLGRVEHLKNPSLKKMYQFYKRYYVPNNMAIIISGDVDPDKTISVINKYFGRLKRKPLSPKKVWKEQPYKGQEVVRVNFPAEEEMVLVFRTVPFGHPDKPALTMLDMILDNKYAGLINLNLNQAQQVKKAGSFPIMNNDYGSQFLYGKPKSGQSLDTVKKLILQQLEIIKKGKFPGWLLQAILSDFIKGQKKKLEDNGSRVYELRNGFIRHRTRKQMMAIIPELQKVTKADVVRVAKKYFGKNYVVGYRVNKQAKIQKLEKPEFKKIKINAKNSSQFYKQLFAQKASKIRPLFIDFDNDFEKGNIRKGVSLYSVKNPFNDLFSLSIVFDTGRYNDAKLPFVCQLLSLSGTKKHTARAIRAQFYRLGCSFNIAAGPRETTIHLEGMENNYDKALSLLFSLLTGFQPDAGTLQRMKHIIISRREAAKRNPGSIRRALAFYSRYGKFSPYIHTLKNNEVKRLSITALKKSLVQLLQYRCRINYFGVRPLGIVKSSLLNYFKAGKRKQTVKPFFPKAKRHPADVVHFLHRPMRQAVVYLGLPGGLYDRKRKAGFTLYNEYFSGSMGSIVFQEMREARALAYAVWAGLQMSKDVRAENYYRGVIGTQADKALDAIQLFRKLIYSIPLSRKRFEVTRSFLINYLNSSRIGYRKISDTIQQWEREGYRNKDPRRVLLQQVKKADFSIIKQTANRITKNKKMVISIVGDKNKIDKRKLSKYGKVVYLKLDDIFNY